MRLRAVLLLSATTMALSITAPAVAQAQASPATSSSCTGSPQRCDVTFQNQEPSGLYLGDNGGHAIVFTYDGGNGQRWDVYQASGDLYLIYNHGTNNVLFNGSSCTSNGGNYAYCPVVQQVKKPYVSSEEWVEISQDPMVFENEDSGSRCLDDPGGNAAAGSRVVLYPCNSTDLAQQWGGS
jgi:hypothetical protein